MSFRYIPNIVMFWMPEESGSGMSEVLALKWLAGNWWSYQKCESIYSRWSAGVKINIPNETRLVILTVRYQQDCVCETAEMQNRRTAKVVLQVATYKECSKVSIRCLRLTLCETGWSYPFSLWVFHFHPRVRIFSHFVLIVMPTWSKLISGLNKHANQRLQVVCAQ